MPILGAAPKHNGDSLNLDLPLFDPTLKTPERAIAKGDRAAAF
jgi:hypothetical protein